MNRILFITTSNLAANPRLVKEIDLAVELGFEVQVICFLFNNWSAALHDDIKKKFGGVEFLEIPAGRKPMFPWLISVFSEKLARVLVVMGINLPIVLSTAVSRRTILLLKKTRKLKTSTWVIGHNPAALYPAYIISKRMNAKIGFDMEDYHPGEGSNRFLQQITLTAMKCILPRLNYVSFASASIQEETEKHVQFDSSSVCFTLLNGFKKNEFKLSSCHEYSGPLKLVWFSQYISFRRGLERVVECLHSFDFQIELHLYGSMDPKFDKEIIKSNPLVIYHGVLNQVDLNLSLSNYHVGLAIEPAKDINNNLAVSNKLMAYLQAGLFVLYTATTGQKEILTLHEEYTRQTDVDLNQLHEDFDWLLKNKQLILNDTKQRFEKMSELSWDNAKNKLKNIWQDNV